MNKYTLLIILNDVTITEVVTAETHTVEQGVYIFWVRDEKDIWCHIAIYPTSCVAITRIEQAEGYAIAKSPSSLTNQVNQSKVNNVFDIKKLDSLNAVKVTEIGVDKRVKSKK